MIKAIIFDIGGVVIDDDFISYAQRFTKKAGMDAKQIYFSVIGSAEWNLYFKGKITEEQAWSAIKSKYLPPAVANEISRTWRSILVPIPGTVELIKQLKPRYRVCFISNVDKESARYAKGKYPEVYALFDDSVSSCDVGLAKPEKGIYVFALKKFKVKPEECVYIDNQPENLPPAEKLGMKAIKFEGPEKLRKQLMELGIKS